MLFVRFPKFFVTLHKSCAETQFLACFLYYYPTHEHIYFLRNKSTCQVIRVSKILKLQTIISQWFSIILIGNKIFTRNDSSLRKIDFAEAKVNPSIYP